MISNRFLRFFPLALLFVLPHPPLSAQSGAIILDCKPDNDQYPELFIPIDITHDPKTVWVTEGNINSCQNSVFVNDQVYSADSWCTTPKFERHISIIRATGRFGVATAGTNGGNPFNLSYTGVCEVARRPVL